MFRSRQTTVQLVLLVAQWAAHEATATRVTSGRELALALASGTADIEVVTDINLVQASWDGVAQPVVLTRNTTIHGTTSRPLPVVMDFSYAKNRVQLRAGVTVLLRNVVLRRFRWGSVAQAPGVDLMAPMPPGETGVLWLDASWMLTATCFPPEVYSELRLFRRPAELRPGPQSYQVPSPPPAGPGNCSNSSSAHPLQRCYVYAGLYIDFGIYTAAIKPSGVPAPNGYAMLLTDVVALCPAVLPPGCIAAYGLLGCSLTLFDDLEGDGGDSTGGYPGPLGAGSDAGSDGRSGSGWQPPLTPPPSSGTAGAWSGGAGEGNSSGGALAPDSPSTASGSSGGSETAAIVGGVVGGVLGALVLVAVTLLAWAALRKRRHLHGGALGGGDREGKDATEAGSQACDGAGDGGGAGGGGGRGGADGGVGYRALGAPAPAAVVPVAPGAQAPQPSQPPQPLLTPEATSTASAATAMTAPAAAPAAAAPAAAGAPAGPPGGSPFDATAAVAAAAASGRPQRRACEAGDSGLATREAQRQQHTTPVVEVVPLADGEGAGEGDGEGEVAAQSSGAGGSSRPAAQHSAPEGPLLLSARVADPLLLLPPLPPAALLSPLTPVSPNLDMCAQLQLLPRPEPVQQAGEAAGAAGGGSAGGATAPIPFACDRGSVPTAAPATFHSGRGRAAGGGGHGVALPAVQRSSSVIDSATGTGTGSSGACASMATTTAATTLTGVASGASSSNPCSTGWHAAVAAAANASLPGDPVGSADGGGHGYGSTAHQVNNGSEEAGSAAGGAAGTSRGADTNLKPSDTSSGGLNSSSGGGDGGGGSSVVTLLPKTLGRGTFGRVQLGLYRSQRVAVKMLGEAPPTAPPPQQQPQPAAAGGGWAGDGGWAGEGGEQSGAAPGPAVAHHQHQHHQPPLLPSQLTEFYNEVQILGRCRHPCIVQLLAVCLTPPRLSLVMEAMETSLDKLIYGGAPGSSSPPQLLPLPKVLHIALQIARGLEYLHPGVVHRDLKPANVLLNGAHTDRPVVKLTDFGLSRIRLATQSTAHPEAGTPAYVAPECFDAANQAVRPQADIYAFGVLLWALLTGQEPWKGHSMVQVAVQVTLLRRTLPLEPGPTGQWPPGLGPERCPRKLRRLMAQCFASDPLRRPAAAEIVKELLLAMQQQQMQAQAQAAQQAQAQAQAAASQQLHSVQQLRPQQ